MRSTDREKILETESQKISSSSSFSSALISYFLWFKISKRISYVETTRLRSEPWRQCSYDVYMYIPSTFLLHIPHILPQIRIFKQKIWIMINVIDYLYNIISNQFPLKKDPVIPVRAASYLRRYDERSRDFKSCCCCTCWCCCCFCWDIFLTFSFYGRILNEICKSKYWLFTFKLTNVSI